MKIKPQYPDMSKNKETGKHSQSANKKISFNMKPDIQAAFDNIHQIFVDGMQGYRKVSKTETFEFMVRCTSRQIIDGYDEAMRQAEESRN